MDLNTKIEVNRLLDELVNRDASAQRKKEIIGELRSINSEFDHAMSVLGIDEIMTNHGL